MRETARVIEVIETTSNRGAGAEGDPVRHVTRYWSRDGELLAERDPCAIAFPGMGDLAQFAELYWAIGNEGDRNNKGPLVDEAFRRYCIGER